MDRIGSDRIGSDRIGSDQIRSDKSFAKSQKRDREILICV